MRSAILLSIALILPAYGRDWSGWRGPNGNGIAAEDQAPPLHWNATRNVIWETPLPGEGHSSPTLVGDRIFLTSSEESRGSQSVLCLDRRSGKVLWEQEVVRGKLPGKIHKKNTHASPTATSDGERVYVTFHAGETIVLAALDLDGKVVWKTTAGAYRPQFAFGYGASPLLYQNLIVVPSEFPRGGFLAAYDKDTGKQVWSQPRSDWTSYSSPIVAQLMGKEQLLLSGNRHITSYDPRTGKLLWETKGSTKSTCGTVVWDGDVVFASGGFPLKETVAIRADGSGQVLWKNKTKAYEQSLLAYQGHVYALDDNGIAHCWRASDGATLWRERLGGPVSASPILAGGHIYASNERGQTFVFKPNPERFELVATNQLGDDAFATPSFCDNRIYARVGLHQGQQRSEVLYCLGTR